MCRKQQLSAKILDHWTQLVAGENYRFTVEVEVRTEPWCFVKKKITCREVTVHRPLGRCSDASEKCYSLTDVSRISCVHSTGNLCLFYTRLVTTNKT